MCPVLRQERELHIFKEGKIRPGRRKCGEQGGVWLKEAGEEGKRPYRKCFASFLGTRESHRRALSKELMQFYLLGPDEVEMNTRLLRTQMPFLWEELMHSALKAGIRQGWLLMVIFGSS